MLLKLFTIAWITVIMIAVRYMPLMWILSRVVPDKRQRISETCVIILSCCGVLVMLLGLVVCIVEIF